MVWKLCAVSSLLSTPKPRCQRPCSWCPRYAWKPLLNTTLEVDPLGFECGLALQSVKYFVLWHFVPPSPSVSRWGGLEAAKGRPVCIGGSCGQRYQGFQGMPMLSKSAMSSHGVVTSFAVLCFNVGDNIP